MDSGRSAAEALYEASLSAKATADFANQERLARKLIALAETTNDRYWLAHGYLMLGSAVTQRNAGSEAMRLLRQARETFKDIGYPYGEARALMNMGAVALDVELDPTTARQMYDECLPLIRKHGDRLQLAIALGNVGEIYRYEGDYAVALRNAGESLAILRELDEPARIGWQLVNLAHYQILRRDYDAAFDALAESFEQIKRQFNARWFGWHFDVCIILAGALDRWEDAARIRGFVDMFRSENGIGRLQAMLPWLAAPIERIGKTFSDDRLDELLAEGEALDLDGTQALVASMRGAVPRAR